MSKKESKMRAIFGSPTKDEINWNKAMSKDHDITSLKMPKQQRLQREQETAAFDFNSLTNLGSHLMDSVYSQVAQPQVHLGGYPNTMFYPSPPGYGVSYTLNKKTLPITILSTLKKSR